MLGEVLEHIEQLNQRISVLDAHIQELPHRTRRSSNAWMRSRVWIDAPPRRSWLRWGQMSRPSPAASTWRPGRVCAPATTSPAASGVQVRFGRARTGCGPRWSKRRGPLPAPRRTGAPSTGACGVPREKRAAVAVAHSIITIVDHLLANPEAVFTELGGDYFLKRDAEQENAGPSRNSVLFEQ